MKLILHLISLSFCLAVIDSALISRLKDNFLRYLSEKLGNINNDGELEKYVNNKPVKDTFAPLKPKDEDYEIFEQIKKGREWAKKHQFDSKDEPKASEKKYVRIARAQKDQEHKNLKNKLMYTNDFLKGDIVDQVIPHRQPPQIKAAPTIGVKYFHMDPVLNALRRHTYLEHPSAEVELRYNFEPDFLEKRDFRRADDESSSSSSGSSSRELKDFKDEFREYWLQKKYEMLNKTRIKGDTVNMLAARPWGVPCGDPNQHDMPWGVCTLSSECESEYRIFRGDMFCGRTQFICCGLQLTTYDMYQGFDVSFDDKSLSTDSDEKRDRKKSSKEKKKKKKARERKKRKRERDRRKKKIKQHIKKIINEIRKILDKQYKNGTKQRKNRTKQLKKFIKDLKKQYKKDRQSVKDLHTSDMIHIDKALLDRLKQMQIVNKNFANNATFREIVLKEMLTKQSARMLLQAYPELEEFLEARRGDGGLAAKENENSKEGEIQYDVEYGYLYY